MLSGTLNLNSTSDDPAQWYKGNNALKKASVQTNYTREEISEIAKCIADPVYFFKNYVYIVSLDHGRIKFNPFDYQVEVIHACLNNRFTLFNVARQQGKTITMCAVILWEILFNKDYTVGIVANNASKSREILGKIREMYEELPWFLKIGVRTWNKGKIELVNRRVVFAGPATIASLRGYTINRLYIDEGAFIDNDVEFFTAAYPVISSGKDSKLTITSTPYGLNLFHKLHTDGKAGRNKFKVFDYDWTFHPERDEAWKETTIGNIGKEKFRQEFSIQFLGSSNTLIEGDVLGRLTWQEPINNDTENTRIYFAPEKDHIYLACVDVSEGLGRDHSVINIIDITSSPFQQVFVYNNNYISPWEFPSIIYPIVKKYNDAYLLIESNSIGKIVADTMHYEYDYDNQINTVTIKGDEKIRFGNNSIGIKTTKKNKSIGCATLKLLIEDNILLVNDFMSVQELYTFVKSNTSFEAEPGKYDDIIMTLVSFAWFTTQTFFDDITKKGGIRGLMRENPKREPPPSIFYSDGTEEEFFQFH